MNRLDNLKKELAQKQAEHALDICEKYGYPKSDEPLCLLVDDIFQNGFNAASAEYEKIITELNGALEWYAKRDHVMGFNITSSLAIEALQKLKDFRE